MSCSHPVVLAHRGGSLNAPENTMAAFRLALDSGADGVECDVRVTRDGEAVLFHDKDTRRLTGFPGSVEALRFSELREMPVMGKGPVAHLNDLLDLLARHSGKTCFFDLGLRRLDHVELLVRRIESAGLAGRSFILTFSNRRFLLRHARLVSPGIGIAVMPLIAVRLLETARRAGASAVCTGWDESWGARKLFFSVASLTGFRKAVDKAQNAGVKVTGGIANTSEDVRWFLSRGVAGVWTDDVPMAREAIYQ